jgi:hypothetical protein
MSLQSMQHALSQQPLRLQQPDNDRIASSRGVLKLFMHRQHRGGSSVQCSLLQPLQQASPLWAQLCICAEEYCSSVSSGCGRLQ